VNSRLPALTLVVLWTAAAAVAQDQPDFSGRWVLDSATQPTIAIPRALVIRQSVVRTNVYGAPIGPFFRDVAVEREYDSGTRSDSYRIGVVGGMVPGVAADGTPRGTRRTYHSVTWKDQALVFESGSHTGPGPGTGEWAERRETWALDSDGRLVVAVATRGSHEASTTTTAAYRRQ
jgi:hypothetical protein